MRFLLALLSFFLVPAPAEAELPLALFRLDSCRSQIRNKRIREAEKAIEEFYFISGRIADRFDPYHLACARTKADPGSEAVKSLAKEGHAIEDTVSRLRRRQIALGKHLENLVEELKEQDLVPPRNCIFQIEQFAERLPRQMDALEKRKDWLCTPRYVPGQAFGYRPFGE